jgi:hypothetical protein
MVRFLESFKLLIYLVACLYAGYRGISEARIALTETQPAAFTAANFAQQHQNQQWIEVLGRVAVEHRHVRPSTYKAHEGKYLAYVTVPIVPEKWTAENLVHVLATFGPMSQASVDGWAKGVTAKPQRVRGQLRPGGFRDPQSMFPNLNLSPTYVTINEGTSPKHVGSMMAFVGLMIVSGGLFIARIRSLLK